MGAITLDLAEHSVTKSGQPVSLTVTEFRLLHCLMTNAGTVVPTSELLKQVWGYSAAVLSRTVDTHVAELRRKLENGSPEPKHILTVRTIGYRLQA